METKKGFITVATGSEQYYILAYYMLLSYRYHSTFPMPFAILCDRHNQWTEEFDEVIIIEKPTYSYCDKLRILDMSPFDETLFIEPDSLIYRDLNGLWEYFKDSPDIGLVGYVFPNTSEKGWWDSENLGELKDKIDFKVMCQGGLYFVRNNGKDLPAFRETCRYIEEHYFEYQFTMSRDVRSDETIMSLAAAVHHFRPVCLWEPLFACWPQTWYLSANIRKGRLSYYLKNSSGSPNKKGYFIHFGTINTLGPWSDGFYYREVSRLKNKSSWRRNLKDRMILFGRRAVNDSRLVYAISNLFPKDLRNKYNKAESWNREHVCSDAPDSYK